MVKDIVLQVLEHQLKVEYNGEPSLKINSVDKNLKVHLSNDEIVSIVDIHLMPLMVLNQETGEVIEYTISDMLEEINRDRSEGWVDYDRSDFLEGWFEFVEGDILMLVQ